MHAVLEMASCSHFVVLELRQPAVCRIHFAIASFWCQLLLFCYITWHGKQRSVTAQCKARWYYESPSRQQKNEGEKIFPHFVRRDCHYVPPYTTFSSGHTTPRYLAPALSSQWTVYPAAATLQHMAMILTIHLFCALSSWYPNIKLSGKICYACWFESVRGLAAEGGLVYIV